ncbi:MAG TPA: amidase family protein, partial [Vicinamibacterales bacterium]|nr:amidase family protein [Vicinamibacterales bacterium]
MTRLLAGVPLLVCLAMAGCGGPAAPRSGPAAAADFTVVEASIPQIQAALQSGRITSRQLTERYLQRIATYEDRLNAIITVNPRALADADAMDEERAAGTVRGPLHGIPIALKDNIHTTDIRTTGGALAFRDLVPPYDATLTKNLRDGGAIIIAKTVLTELAH